MNTPRTLLPVLVAALLPAAPHFTRAGELLTIDSKQVEAVSLDEPWTFKLEIPSWAAGVYGEVGVNNRTTHVSIGFDEILRHLDFTAAVAGEAHRGRFGVLGGVLYLSASDGIGTNGTVAKLDFRFDEYLADFALSWKVVEAPRGYIELLLGTRYVNLYQHLRISPNDDRIEQVSEKIVSAVADRVRDRALSNLSEKDLQAAIRAEVDRRLRSDFRRLEGRSHPLPVAPLAAGVPQEVREAVQRILVNESADAAGEARRAGATGTSVYREALARALERRRGELVEKVANTLEHKLNRSLSKGNDWFDPYIGFRARYQLSPAFYTLVRADVGGFGVGSEITWQAYGAVGCQLTRSIVAEAGYRCLYMNYRNDGLISDTTTRGVQISLGVVF